MQLSCRRRRLRRPFWRPLAGSPHHVLARFVFLRRGNRIYLLLLANNFIHGFKQVRRRRNRYFCSGRAHVRDVEKIAADLNMERGQSRINANYMRSSVFVQTAMCNSNEGACIPEQGERIAVANSQCECQWYRISTFVRRVEKTGE